MPFRTPFNPWNNDLEAYIWSVNPGVYEDPLAINQAQQLTIEPNLANVDIRIPPLDRFTTGRLRRLEFQDLDVTEMPKIPSSVQVLVFRDTTLTNLTQINVDWTNIQVLELHNNPGLNGTSLIVPEGISTVFIQDQKIDLIRLPTTITSVDFGNSVILKVTGHLPHHALHWDYGSHLPKYSQGCDLLQHQCNLELELIWDVPGIAQIMHKWLLKKIEFIQCVNRVDNYRTYAEFGSIPTRIRNAYKHQSNPIVTAMNLASNYPRRMAEFIAEETMIG